VTRLRTQWARYAEAGAGAPPTWTGGLAAVRSSLEPLTPLDPRLGTALRHLDTLPVAFDTQGAYGEARDHFDEVTQALNEIRRRQEGAFRGFLFFALALAAVSMGFLLWKTVRLRSEAEWETRLAGLAERRARIQDHERARIARELHDGVAQDLARARLGLHEIGCATCPHDRHQVARADLTHALDQSLSEIRWLCGTLRAARTQPGHLDPVVQEAASSFRQRFGLPVTVQKVTEVPGPWDGQDLHEVARILQEGLTNVGRHSGATEVVVRYLAVGPRLNILLEDNGRGLTDEEGFGMKGIRERVDLLGGEVRWDPGTPGTRMVVTLPLEAP